MSTAKVAISMDAALLKKVDSLVKARVFPNRSRAIQAAVKDKLQRMSHSRLARECAKLDPKFEAALAEEGFGGEGIRWPEY